MVNKTNNKKLEELAQVLFKEDSKRIPTEILPLMVVFGLIALFQGIASRIVRSNPNGNKGN